MADAVDGAIDRARKVTIRRFASAADADRADLDYWRQIPDSDRAREAWRLSQELWRLTGGPRHESGLCRSVARVRRG
jgi:hypothetical protein